eukprot:5127074-Prymnesium_polylepis.1
MIFEATTEKCCAAKVEGANCRLEDPCRIHLDDGRDMLASSEAAARKFYGDCIVDVQRLRDVELHKPGTTSLARSLSSILPFAVLL